MIVLETDRLLFGEHRLEYLDAFCDMEADPDVRRYVGGYPRTREAAEEKYRAFLRPPNGLYGLWATIFKPENRFIGYCGIARGSGASEGALGYYLARPYWQRGLATEAGRAFVDFGFNELRLARIAATVEVGNDASVRVLQKLGFSWVRLEKGKQRSFNHFELVRPLTLASPSGA